MLRFSANLTMLFADAAFLDRFERAARAGFTGVEFMFPYPYDKHVLAETLERCHLKQVLHNLPAGNWDAGERGIACLPGREGEFQDGVGLAITYAKALGCPLVNCLVGKTPGGIDPAKVRATLVANLSFAAKTLAAEGIGLAIEPLNSRMIPDFYLVRTADALKLIAEVGHPNLRLQYDVYHMQVMEGDLTATIRENLSQIGHIQIADNPGRHEPGTGEINFANLLGFIDAAGYAGWIGCEYVPAGKTEEGLGWLAPFREK